MRPNHTWPLLALNPGQVVLSLGAAGGVPHRGLTWLRLLCVGPGSGTCQSPTPRRHRQRGELGLFFHLSLSWSIRCGHMPACCLLPAGMVCCENAQPLAQSQQPQVLPCSAPHCVVPCRGSAWCLGIATAMGTSQGGRILPFWVSVPAKSSSETPDMAFGTD